MSNKTECEIDPYQALGISYHASEEAIQKAFQAKMGSSNGSEEIVTAYGMIRNEEGRERVRWSSIRYCLKDPELEIRPSLDIALLIQELAFLTAWELGDDSCLKS